MWGTTSAKQKRSWVASSFDDDDFLAPEPKTTKRGSSTSRRDVPKTVKKARDPSLWSGEFVGRDRLAVHKKKVEEVEQWLISALTGVKGHRILLLTGPPGCGKTACVRALAHDLALVVKEWINPSSVRAPSWAADEPVPWIPGDQVTESGFVTLFHEFVNRVNKYGSVAIVGGAGGGEYGGQVLLVEDMPNVFYREPSQLHDILRRYVLSGRTPAVFIVSDAPRLEHSATRLFPADLCDDVGVTTVQFNPVATTLMTKALKDACDRHGVSASASLLGSLTEAAGGDLRSAINALQFSLDCSETKKSLFAVPAKKKTRKKNLNATRAADSAGDTTVLSTAAKDSSLPLFRSLGRVLYCKRSDSPAAPLPPHLREEERAPATADPELVLESCCLSPPSFTAFLHQNYPPFMRSVAGAAVAVGYLCDADLLLSHWADGERLWAYGTIAARGVMHATGSGSGSDSLPRTSSFRPLVSPAFTEVVRKSSRLLERVRLEHPTANVDELTSLVLPYSSIIAPHKYGSSLALEVGSLLGHSRPQPQKQRHEHTASGAENSFALMQEPLDYDDTIEDIPD